MPGERLKKRLSSPWLVSGRLGWARLGPARAEPSRAQPSQAEPNRAKPSPTEPNLADPSRDKQNQAEPTPYCFLGVPLGILKAPQSVFLTFSGRTNSLAPIKRTRPNTYKFI